MSLLIFSGSWHTLQRFVARQGCNLGSDLLISRLIWLHMACVRACKIGKSVGLALLDRLVAVRERDYFGNAGSFRRIIGTHSDIQGTVEGQNRCQSLGRDYLSPSTRWTHPVSSRHIMRRDHRRLKQSCIGGLVYLINNNTLSDLARV